MNNHLYIQVNDKTDIKSGIFKDGSVFVTISQEDRIYKLNDINNSGEQNQRDLDVYLHFASTDDIKKLITSLESIKHNLYYAMLNNQNDEYNYGHNVENKTTDDMGDIDL